MKHKRCFPVRLLPASIAIQAPVLEQRCLRLQRVFVIGVLDGLSNGIGLVATFFFIRYQTIIASRREISLARQFSRVNLVNRREINFARHCFGTGLFIIAVQENLRDMLAKSSEANPKRASVADSIYAT
jgi:hypothetical protein